MDPTPEEIVEFRTCDDVAEWAGLKRQTATTTTEEEEATKTPDPRGSFFELLGVQAADHFRVLANIPEPDLAALLEAWQVGGKAPTPAQVSQAALTGRCARVAAGVQPTLAQLRDRALHEKPAEPAQATKTNTVKLANVLDQSNDSEVCLASTKDFEEGFKEFSRRLGGLPEPEEEVTREQFTALKALFESACPPYTDFAVWGPFNRRLQKRLKLSGLTLGEDGTLVRSELYGPPSFEEWERSFRPFRTGCIMLNQVDPANLDLYANHVRAAVQRFGAAAWPVIYQADVRARLEQIERVRRRVEFEAEQAQQLGGKTAFDQKRPWNFCFRALVEDDRFWRKEVEQPALLILAHARSMGSALGGDAPVGAGSSGSTGVGGDIPGGDPFNPRKRKMNHLRVHELGENGRLLKNRGGKKLCEAWQDGSCQVGQKGKCPRNPGLVHQCAICLSQDHGAKFCSANPAKALKKGKGKGKGKKGEWNRAPY